MFLFEGNGQLTELQTEYHTGKATVNLAEYRASLEELKETMFELIRGNQRPDQKTTSESGLRHAIGCVACQVVAPQLRGEDWY